MFSKSQLNHKAIWHKTDMNDNQLNNKVVIRTLNNRKNIKITQKHPI